MTTPAPAPKTASTNGSTSALQRALEGFGRSRLLAFDRDAVTRSPTVEVVHEALLREWPRLRNWLRESRGEMHLQRLVAQAAVEWEAASREPGFLLTGARLAQIEGWQREATVALTPSERALFEASLAERTRLAQLEAERQAREISLERRARRILQGLVSVLLGATVVAASLAWWANDRRLAAQVAEQEAVSNLAMSEAQRLAAEANRMFIENRGYETAALLALRSINLGYSPQGDEALSRAARQVYAEHLIPGHKGGITSVSLATDIHRLLIAEPGLPPILLDPETGALQLRLDALPVGADTSVLSTDGQYIVTSKDRTVQVWEAATGHEIYRRQYLNSVTGVDISTDDERLLVVGWDKRVHVLELHTGQERQQLSQPDALLAGKFSPDGRLILTGDVNGRLWLWDWQAQATRLELTVVGWPWGLDFAPDMSTFSAASYDKVAYIFETATGRLLREIPHTDELNATLAYSPDGRIIVTGDQRGVAHLWDVQTGTEARRLLHDVGVASVVFTRDGRDLVTAAEDGSVRFWRLDTKPVQIELPGAGHTEGKLQFTSDGEHLFAQGHVFDSHTGAPGPDTGVFGFSALSRDGGTAFVLNLAPFEIRVLDPRTWTTLLSEPVPCMEEPYGIGISPDGTLIGLGSYGTPYTICVIDSHTGVVVREIDTDAVITSLAFTADNRTLLAGGCNETARLYDLATGAVLRSLSMPIGSDCLNEVTVSPDGTKVATVGFGGNVALWDIASGRRLQTFVGHMDTVWGASFSPDGHTLLTSGGDGTARLWDIATGIELRRFSGHTASVWRAAFSPDGRRIATTSSDNSVKVWLTDLNDLIAALCQALPRDLTQAERQRFGVLDPAPTCSTVDAP